MPLLPEIANWYSAGAFSKKAVPAKIVKTILDAGRKAPSIKNRQEWRFIVVTDKSKRKSISDACYQQAYMNEVPVIIALCTTNIRYTMPNGILSYPVDIAVSATFMMLQARHEGMAVCPTTVFKSAEVHEILSIPFSMKVVMLLPIGYPSDTPSSPQNRKSLKSLCGYDHW